MSLFGIDVSEHQDPQLIDYPELCSHLKWAIVREGYGVNSLDKHVKTHIARFKQYGVPIIGTYHFIYAISDDEARQNAENCLRNIEALGLPKTTRVYCDFEYHTVKVARDRGVVLGPKECRRFTEIFLDVVSKAGYPVGIYTNGDYYVNWYGRDMISKYPLWFADYTGAPDYNCIIQQFGYTRLSGYKFDLDGDYLFDPQEITRVQSSASSTDQKVTKADLIEKVITLAKDEKGYLEKASNSQLNDKYSNAGTNNYTKYGRDMHQIQPSTMDFPAAWCDAFVDWLFWKIFGASLARRMLCGDFDDYTVVSANYYKRAGRWYITPEKGDQVFFKNSGGICHTGLVIDVIGNKVYTIEGNSGNAVKEHSYTVTDSYIAGFGRPYWELALNETPAVPTQPSAPATGGGLNKTEEFVGRVDVSEAGYLNVRTWAGVEYPNIKSYPILKRGNLVSVCDTVTAANGSKWYYIKIADKYYGFVSSQYIEKV